MSAGLVGGYAFIVAAVSAWRLSELTLEGAIEGRLRIISHLGGDFRDPARGLFQRSRRHLKPPASQIRHGRLGEIPSEALHQGGPRNTHLIRETRDGPGVGNAVVKQSETFPYDGIARSREPAGLLLCRCSYGEHPHAER